MLLRSEFSPVIMRMRKSAVSLHQIFVRSELSPLPIQRSFSGKFWKINVQMAPPEESATNLPREPEPKTRENRMDQYKEKCERIIHYLRHGKHQDGLTKNQQRVVRGQAKNYVLHRASNCLFAL